MADNTTPSKPGWKTTEAWLVFVALGIGTFVLEQSVEILKVLAAKPDANPTLVAISGLALVVIPVALKWMVAKYTQARTELKLTAPSLPATPDAAMAKANELKP